MSSKNTRISLNDWDMNKVTVDIYGTDKKEEILYNGKPVEIDVLGPDDDPLMLFSFNGVERTMKYDQKTKTMTNIWEGDYNLNTTICRELQKAKPYQRKLIDIFEDIKKKAQEFYPEKKVADTVAYTYIKKEHPKTKKLEKTKEIDVTKGVYLKFKVGYTAPKDAPKFTDQKSGKEVPEFQYRRPNGTFYDISKSKDDAAVKDAFKEANIRMNTRVIAKLGLCDVNGTIYITKRLYVCYFLPAQGGDKMDTKFFDKMKAKAIESANDGQPSEQEQDGEVEHCD